MGDNIKKTASGFALSSGAVLHDRYVIESVVGQGGFGIVYSAKDRQLDIKVAVKEFFVGRLAARGNDGITVEVKEGSKLFEEYRYRKLRFLNEARNLAKFSKHPNIVNVYDFFEENNTAYMVMEYLDGISMNSYMKQNGGKLDETSVLEIARSVAGALSSMHKEGIYHLDIAPDNIFLCSGSVIKLIDFGAAKFNEKEKGIKDVILKPGYSPPEQYIINGKVDERSDIYALAATMYRALTGTKPPEATNRKTIDTLVAPKKIVSEIKEPLNDAIVRALSVEPELRFASVKEFVEGFSGIRTVKDPAEVLKVRRAVRFAAVILMAIAFGTAVFLLLTRNYKNRKIDEENNPVKAAKIDFWICTDYGSDKFIAYDTFLKEFMRVNEEVIINLTCYPEESYEEKLKEKYQKDGLPDVFESNGINLATFEGLRDVGHILELEEAEECTLLKSYPDRYQDEKKLPVSFDVPVVCVITHGKTYKQTNGKTFTDLSVLTEEGYAVDEEKTDLIRKNFGTELILGGDTAESFYNDDVAVLFSSAEHLRKVKEKTEMYQKTFLLYDSNTVKCEYMTEFSIGSSDERNEAIQDALLESMLGRDAQMILFISMGGDGELPLNDSCLAKKCKGSEIEHLTEILPKMVVARN